MLDSNVQPNSFTLSSPSAWLLLFAVALAARGGWGLLRSNARGSALEFPDEEQYWLMANSLRHEGALRDELGFQATRMPLYPALLALAAGSDHGVTCVRIAQWIVGAFAAVLAAMLGSQLAGRVGGWASGLLVALDPFLVFFSSLLLTETLFITLLLALWVAFAPIVLGKDAGLKRWLWVAVLGALCVYTRESALGLIGLGALLYLMASRFDRRALQGVTIVFVGIILSLLPWAIRNRQVIGEWRWLTTRGGISLYDGVRPGATGAGDLGDVKQSPAVQGLSESEWNRYFLRESWREIRRDPPRIAALAGRKWLRMWNPLPNVSSYRSSTFNLVSAAWMVPLLLMALGGMVFSPAVVPRAAPVVIFLLLPAVYLSVLHMLFVGSVRYRLPAMPMIAVLASMGFAYFHTAWCSRRTAEDRRP